MRLQESDIRKFRQLWLSNFGEELSLDEAREKLALLVRQVQIVYRPITRKQLQSRSGV